MYMIPVLSKVDTPPEDKASLPIPQQEWDLEQSDMAMYCMELLRTNTQMRADLQHFSRAMQNAVSQRIMLGNRFKLLQKQYEATEQALKGLWILATTPTPDSQAASVAEICAQVEQLLMPHAYALDAR